MAAATAIGGSGFMIAFLVAVWCFLGPALGYGIKYESLEADQDLYYWKKDGWTQLYRVQPSKVLKLTFALKQRNVQKLEQLLLQVSNPDSQIYGRYLSVDEITKIVSPTDETLDLVQTWLQQNGVKVCTLTKNRDFLVCEMQRNIAEQLLKGAVFYYFKHPSLHKKAIRSVSRYYVPAYVEKHLDFVGGLHRFPAVNWGKTKSSVYKGIKTIQALEKQHERSDELKGETVSNDNIHIGVYPSVLRQRYNVSSKVGSHPNNSQVVAQFLEQYYHATDLKEFMAMFGGSFTHQTEIAKVIGPNPGRAGIEASLDTQYIMGLGANITTWFWSTGGRHESQEPFLEWMLDISNTSAVPWVHSVSYGDVESSLSVAYMERINTEFMKAGLRGLSILFASGDDGAGCKNETFAPSFPASSPYVTTVGGTAFNNPFGVTGEYAYEISGGGFSNVFKRASYQVDQVESFLNQSGLPPSRYYNANGRGYPDIAALCNHFWVVNNLIPVPGVMGTSASTPTTAGIISLVNDVRFHNGKPAMGFLNPFLYKSESILYDVTSGCNEGCLENDKGFCASKGWDPVTGNGTPNFPALVKAALMIFERRH